MPSIDQNVVAKSSPGWIASELRDRIVSGRLPFGARLSDRELASELNLSRTPIREAILHLRANGLIVTRPQSGTFVFAPDDGEIAALCEVRGIMEAGALRCAANRDHGAVNLGRIVAEASLALEVSDLRRCEDADTSFHETLVRASDNIYLIESYGRISDKVRALRARLPPGVERVRRAVTQHRRVVDLLAVGRVDEAARELESHIRNVADLCITARRNEPT